MLDKIIRYSLHNRLTVLVAAVLLVVAGLYTGRTMDVDVFPDLNAPTVVVMTEARGMAAEEVERLVSFPLETAVNGATGVRRVRSTSTTGFSVVWVEFDWGTDVQRARQTVTEKITAAASLLPPGVGAPTLGPQSSILGEVMFVALTADTTSMQRLRTLADWTLRPRLLATGGVAGATVLGGDIREYQILLSPERMRQRGVSLDQVYAAVEDMNRNAPGGVLYEYGNEYVVRGMLSTTRTADLARAVVGTGAGGGLPVTLGDVARVQVGSRSPRMGVASHHGREAVILTVTKQPGVSTLRLTERLDSTLAGVARELPADVHMSTDIYRQERFIRAAIDNVTDALMEGGVFVVIVLFIFLMNARSTLISLVTIPLSLLVTLLTLHIMGLTVNTMSLGGMAIAIGSLVDDAIVDVENVFRHLRENRNLPSVAHRRTLAIVFLASREVRMPILYSTLIIIVSFVPLFFLSGLEGSLLAPLGIAFIAALLASTVVALTLTPVLCSYLLGGHGRKDGEPAEREAAVARALKRVYRRALCLAIGHKRRVLLPTAVALVVALVLLATLGRNFLPPFNEGSLTINVSTLPGVSLSESDSIGRQVERLLMGVPEIQIVGRKTGRAELDEHALGVNVSEIEAPFALDGRSKAEMVADVRHRLAAVPGISVEVGAPITHRIDAMLSGTRAGIAIKLFGTDLGQMYATAARIREQIADVEGLADLNVEQQVERPQLQIVPRREMLVRYGVTLPALARAVRVGLGGERVSQVYEDGQSLDLTLLMAPESRATAADIARLAIDTPGGQVPLGTLADMRSAMGPDVVNHENAARKIVVSANVSGRSLSDAVSDIRQRVESRVRLPEGYHVEYGGQFESEQAASRILLVATIFSVLVIFLLLYAQFRDATQAAIILLNLPLALIGGVAAVWWAGGTLSIPALIGFISLFGIATRGGMLLVSHYADLRATGVPVVESVVRGSLDRLNPILMTALTSALALIPLAFGGELPGGEIQSPMAKVILGGLLTSTLLNLFVVPVVYLIVEQRRNRKTKK